MHRLKYVLQMIIIFFCFGGLATQAVATNVAYSTTRDQLSMLLVVKAVDEKCSLLRTGQRTFLDVELRSMVFDMEESPNFDRQAYQTFVEDRRSQVASVSCAQLGQQKYLHTSLKSLQAQVVKAYLIWSLIEPQQCGSGISKAMVQNIHNKGREIAGQLKVKPGEVGFIKQRSVKVTSWCKDGGMIKGTQEEALLLGMRNEQSGESQGIFSEMKFGNATGYRAVWRKGLIPWSVKVSGDEYFDKVKISHVEFGQLQNGKYAIAIKRYPIKDLRLLNIPQVKSVYLKISFTDWKHSMSKIVASNINLDAYPSVAYFEFSPEHAEPIRKILTSKDGFIVGIERSAGIKQKMISVLSESFAQAQTYSQAKPLR